MGPNETLTVGWGDSNSVSVHLNGSNSRTNPVANRPFPAGDDGWRLTDGRPHHVRAQYIPPSLYVFFDHEALPSLQTTVNLTAHGVTDSAGLAWVGFTASSGLASMDADVTSFAFCQRPGCTAV